MLSDLYNTTFDVSIEFDDEGDVWMESINEYLTTIYK